MLRVLVLFGLVLSLPLGALGLLGATALDPVPSVEDNEASESSSPAPIELTAGLPAPERLDGIGDSSIAVTTESPEAQYFFDQGLRLIHCFWDFEAFRSFEEAARLDPELAMAYWGMALSLQYSREYEEQVDDLLEKAHTLVEGASEREKLYVGTWYEANQIEDGGEARDQKNRGLEALVDQYPDDADAKLLLALAVMSGYDGESRPEEGTVYAQALLSDLLHEEPDNAAAHHYWIHAVEEARPERALASADRLLELAPNSGHMMHMPGHIYSKVGDYVRAREIFLQSKAVDEVYMERTGVTAVDNWNYVHNLFYLVSDASESGRYAEGLGWARELQEIPVDPDRPHAGGNHNLFHQGRIPWPQFLLRYGAWQEAATASDQILAEFELHDESSRYYLEGLSAFARGMAALPDAARARDHWGQLDARILRLDRLEDPREHLAGYRQRELELHSGELEGLILLNEGETERGIERLVETADDEWSEMERADPARYSKPSHEILGGAYLAEERWAEARDAYSRALEARPQSGHALFGIAESYRGEGSSEEARLAFEKFLRAWSGADPDREEILAARRFLASEIEMTNSP